MDNVNSEIADLVANQEDLDRAVNQLSDDINPIFAKASCDEISQFDIFEDGYYMIRI